MENNKPNITNKTCQQDLPHLLTAEEVGAQLKKSARTIREYAKTKRLTPVGGHRSPMRPYMFTIEEVTRFLRGESNHR